MTTKNLLELDWHSEENQEKIQSALRMIKPLAKCSDEPIPLEKIERAIKIMCVSYDVFIRQLYPDIAAGEKELIWRSEMYDRKNLQSIGMCFGCNAYEVLAKTCIFLYSFTRKRGKN